MLCMYAFPQCHIVNGYPVGLPLCYEDCVAVRDLFCYNDWALVENNKQHGVYYTSRGHFRLPNCSALPRLSLDKPVCSHAKLTDLPQDKLTCESTLNLKSGSDKKFHRPLKELKYYLFNKIINALALKQTRKYHISAQIFIFSVRG